MSGSYWPRVLIGLAICGASIVAVDWGLYHLVRTGNCGTSPEGGIVGPPCPPGTGLHIMALIVGVFAGLAGMGIYATRSGEAARPSRAGIGAVMWLLLFVTLAGAVALAAFGPANTDSTGTKAAAIVMAAIFIPTGLIPLPFLLRSSAKKQLALELMTSGERCPGEVVEVNDTGITINDNPHVKITVRAEPYGEAPFTIVKTATVSRVSIPRRGDRCTVFYDPADRQNRNGFTFDQVPGMPPTGATPTGGASVSIGPIATGPTTTPVEPVATGPLPTGPAMPGDLADEDAIEKIERLGELRDKGLISDAEFDIQKRRLLGEL